MVASSRETRGLAHGAAGVALTSAYASLLVAGTLHVTIGAWTLFLVILAIVVLPFMALGWLCIGAIAAGLLRTRRPATFRTLGRVSVPVDREPAA